MCILCTAPERFQHTQTHTYVYKERERAGFSSSLYFAATSIELAPNVLRRGKNFPPTLLDRCHRLIFRVKLSGWPVSGNLNVSTFTTCGLLSLTTCRIILRGALSLYVGRMEKSGMPGVQGHINWYNTDLLS